MYKFEIPACAIRSLTVNASFEADPELPVCELRISGPDSARLGETVTLRITTAGEISGNLSVSGLEQPRNPDWSVMDRFYVTKDEAVEVSVKVTALTGEVSMEASDCRSQFSEYWGDLGQDYFVPGASWSAPVAEPVAAASVIRPNPDAPDSVRVVRNPDYDPGSPSGDESIETALLGIPITAGDAAGSGTAVGDIRDWVAVEDRLSVEVLTAGGQAAESAAHLATGQVVAASDAEGRILARAAIVIRGDVLGTGRINISQLTRMVGAMRGDNPLAGVYLQAADFNQSGGVDISDLVQVARLLAS